MAKKSLMRSGGNGTTIQQGPTAVALSLGQTVADNYTGIVEDRKWVRNEIRDRIDKTKEYEKKYGVTCKACNNVLYRPHIEDSLLSYYTEFNRILDSLSRFDSRHDIAKLLESAVVEVSRTSFDLFLKFVPQEQRESLILEYMNSVKTKTEELIRRSAL
jgi:hypothetical protein